MIPSDAYFWEWMVLELQCTLTLVILIIAIAMKWGRKDTCNMPDQLCWRYCEKYTSCPLGEIR